MNRSSSSSGLIDTKFEEHQLCGSKQCPGCGHKFDSKPDWFGLPAGVKFDPTDQELIEHLEAKAESKDGMKSHSHPLIDEFIPTIEGEDGICYTHPEKLPGVTRDGLSRHFFHRPSKAYTTGTRKRRKIQNESCNVQGSGGETRWHKTGKTRPVQVNGTQKGCKKILVLYTNFGKNRKPEKTNWVMHQYHLGVNEEEKEGELVVSKIFYQTQPRQCNMLSEHRSTSTMMMSTACEGSSTDLNNLSRRDSTGSGSCNSSKEISINNYAAAIDVSRLRSDHHHHNHQHPPGFMPSSSHYMVHDHHQRQHQHHNIASSTVFSAGTERPSLPVNSILSPSLLQQHNTVSLDENSYHVPRIMLQTTQSFQQQDSHHHEPEARSGSGLEDLIMSCSSNYVKQESSTPNPQEADWSKFSTFWPDLDNHQDPHG